MKMLRHAGWMVLLLAPVIVLAEPTTRPAPSPKVRPPLERVGFRDVREADWDEALKFFQQHSPHRAAIWGGMDEPRKTRYKSLIIARYHSLRWLTKEDTPLRDIKIKQIEIEDKIVDIKSQLMEADAAAANAESLRKELRERVKELFQLRMDERKERIIQLESLVKQEKERLQKDEMKKEQLIDTHYREVLNAHRPDIIGERPRSYGKPDRGGPSPDNPKAR